MIEFKRKTIIDSYNYDFTRNSLAYIPDGRIVYPNQARFIEREGHVGVLVEEGTTNLLVNSDFCDSTSTGIADQWYQQAVVNVSCSNGEQTFTATKQYGAIYQNLILPTQASFTASAEIKGPGRIVLYFYDANDNYLGGMNSSVGVDGRFTPRWIKVDRSDVRRVQFRIEDQRSEGFTPIAFRKPQLEMKLYTTSFTPASRLAELLTIPTNCLSPAEGCWRQWVYIDNMARRQGSASIRVFDIKRQGQYNGILICHSSSVARWNGSTYADDGTSVTIQANDSYTPDGWNLFELKWSQAELAMVINGIKLATAENPPLPTTTTGIATIGSSIGKDFYLNAVHGQVQILNHYPSDEESLAAYQRGVNNLAWDEHTLAIYTFNGPQSQRTAKSIIL